MTDGAAGFIESRIADGKEVVERLLAAPVLRFDPNLRAHLPVAHGIYRIFEVEADPALTLRAGRTKSAAEGLRQRIYQNHYQGDQAGNIRAQLVRAGRCPSSYAAKEFLRESCAVQFLVIEDEEERKWAEHFMLAVLRPDESD